MRKRPAPGTHDIMTIENIHPEQLELVQPKVPAKAGSIDEERLVINTIRLLGADLCQQVGIHRLRL